MIGRKGLKISLLTLTLLFALPALATELSSDVEVPYEHAVVAFNEGKFSQALEYLGRVLAKDPAASPALELKALALKATGKDTEAMRVYGELVRTGPISQRAKYYFEIGCLLHKNKRYAQARPYLNAAINGRFNVGASHFFLGLIDFEDKRYEAAESHLRDTIASDALDLKPLAYFYLGMLYYKTGYVPGAVRGMRYSRDAVQPWLQSTDEGQRRSAEDIIETSRKVLRSLDRVHWFGNITMLTEYDSNALLLPDAVPGSQAIASGRHTVKQIFTGGGGLMSSPARMFQAVASYRLFLNYNDNTDAKSYDFFSHIAAVYVNYKPWLRLHPGAKVEGNYTFQNLAGRDNNVEFHPYSLTGETGPYLRYEVNSHLLTELDGFYRPAKYYLDPPTGDDRRTGDGYLFRFSTEYASPWKYLAPTAYASLESDRTDGRNWRALAWGLGFSNLCRFSAINAVTLGFDISFPRFEDRVPVREDTIYTVRASWLHELTRHFSVIAEAAYSADRSNLESLFTYTRFYGGAGLDYTF